jgi:hypothetical protein
MHDREAIINFVSSFRNQVQALSDTTKDPKHLLSDLELSTFFIEKLCASANVEGDARFALLNCKRELNSDNNLKTLTKFEDELCLAESQAFKTGASRTNLRSDKPPGRDIVCGCCSKRGHTASACYSNPANRRQQANHTQTGRGHGHTPSAAGQGGGHKRIIQCFNCGLNHSLSVCLTATPKARERIYREKLGPRTNSGCG